MRVCQTLERDAGYINDYLLSGISSALTDVILLPCISDNVNVNVNITHTTSRNHKRRLGLNTTLDTLNITT